MREDEMKNLKTGCIVRHVSGGDVYVVTANYGGRVTAVRTIDITNSTEWNEVVLIEVTESREALTIKTKTVV